jgi:CRISPR-associated protein Csm1
MNDTHDALVHYGTYLLGIQLGHTGPPPDLPFASSEVDWRQHAALTRAREILGDESLGAATPPTRLLLSIFSQVSGPAGQPPPQAPAIRLRRLGLDLDAQQSEDAAALWQGFVEQCRRIPQGPGAFDTFCSLFTTYAWNAPAALPAAETGISLHEQFKATTALTCCLGRASDGQLLLIGGDLPGIQSMLYTITSKGVAKGLRGRSFYLQMLNEVVVRAILRELDLPWACLLYNAGGNFKILAPATALETLAELRREINERLMALHRGELFIALDWQRLDAQDFSDAAAFSQAMMAVGRAVDERKQAWFADEAGAHYGLLLGPVGVGSVQHCDVCDVELPPGSDEPRCRQCASFERLAQQLARVRGRESTLVVHSLVRRLVDADSPPAPQFDKPTWESILESFGYRYEFAVSYELVRATGTPTLVCRVNDAQVLPAQVRPELAYGFRFLPNATPWIVVGEMSALVEALQSRLDTEEAREIREGYVRSTTIMALHDAAGVPRYGVLRMDVDHLGQVFAERLQKSDWLHVSALSAAMSLFFEGWLNQVCQRAAEEWDAQLHDCLDTDPAAHSREARVPYIIYAGGDDLFIVGYWDLLPRLAEHIRRDFGDYVTRGCVRGAGEAEPAHITISAGIFAETARFPLYQAAEFAHEALSRAKGRTVLTGSGVAANARDGVCFLGTTVGWDEFRQARELALKLTRLIKVGVAGKTMPKSVLALLASVSHLYGEDAGRAGPGEEVYGQWMWRLAYGLAQLAGGLARTSEALSNEILKLAGDSLNLREPEGAAKWKMIPYLDLPTRWAEFLTRAKGG